MTSCRVVRSRYKPSVGRQTQLLRPTNTTVWPAAHCAWGVSYGGLHWTQIYSSL